LVLHGPSSVISSKTGAYYRQVPTLHAGLYTEFSCQIHYFGERGCQLMYIQAI